MPGVDSRPDRRPFPEPHVVRHETREIGRRMWPDAYQARRILLPGLALALGVGIAVRVAGGDAALAGLLVAGIGILSIAAAWAWLRDPVKRRALDVGQDHRLREDDEWRASY